MDNQAREDGKIFQPGTQIGPAVPLPDESLWTVEEVAEYLKLQPETIRSMARRGELPAIKLGKVWRFTKIAIHDMLIQKS